MQRIPALLARCATTGEYPSFSITLDICARVRIDGDERATLMHLEFNETCPPQMVPGGLVLPVSMEECSQASEWPTP